MDFAEAQRLLNAAQNESLSRRHPGRLDRMRRLLELLGDPQRRFPSIHVGGTSGKGSTATMAAAMLHAAGYKVGLHTKPHLRSVTERACIDGAAVSEERFAQLFERMLPAIDVMRGEDHGPPSYFELLVALAFRYFADEHVDIAVIEVGIGGKLDGTNVLEPLVAVLTNVGTDHMDVLGDTVEAIALDKSGIIKAGIPVVTAAEHAGALQIIVDAAALRGAPLTHVRDSARIEEIPGAAYEQRARISTRQATYDIALPVLGEFQLLNAATAIVALEQIATAFPVPPSAVSSGLGSIALPGRMEYFPSRPALLFDVAHNVEKAEALAGGLERHFPGRRLVIVAAAAEGKAFEKMLAAWASLPAHFIFTVFDVSHRNALAARRLAVEAEHLGLAARAVDDPVEALGIARRMARADDVVVVTGSTFLVAQLREWFLDNAGKSTHARV
ncbi:MAG TPA: folylpolyglutamate synthase/dihydrofolate synthase family protein [Candidatus Eremiobacteraceae bacterium]|nr:folylpolyglutamate synthase/dihydrofolate synthase family protein [Candidatus Eremiobacteraceae bacterium]